MGDQPFASVIRPASRRSFVIGAATVMVAGRSFARAASGDAGSTAGQAATVVPPADALQLGFELIEAGREADPLLLLAGLRARQWAGMALPGNDPLRQRVEALARRLDGEARPALAAALRSTLEGALKTAFGDIDGTRTIEPGRKSAPAELRVEAGSRLMLVVSVAQASRGTRGGAPPPLVHIQSTGAPASYHHPLRRKLAPCFYFARSGKLTVRIENRSNAPITCRIDSDSQKGAQRCP
jgi:hypothetical protein